MSRNLSLDEVRKILAVSRKRDLRGYLLFTFMAGYGFKVGEIVGTDPRRRDKKSNKWVSTEPNLKGLQIQDLRQDGIFLRKGAKQPEKRFLSPDIVTELRDFIGSRRDGRIIELTVGRVEQLTRDLTRTAGLSDWKSIHPHMFRDFFSRHEGILPDAIGQVSEARIERKNVALTIDNHERAQAALLELGNILGYDTYTADPSKDPGEQFYKSVDGEGDKKLISRTLGQIATLSEVPDFAPKGILESVRKIDVVWFKEEFPAFCFEVEHPTNVREGLLRQFQTSRHAPNAKFFIIAPEEQREKFGKEVATYPFKQIRSRYVFKDYRELLEFYDGVWKFHDLRSKFQL